MDLTPRKHQNEYVFLEGQKKAMSCQSKYGNINIDIKNEVIELNRVTKEKGIQNNNDRNLGAIEENSNISCLRHLGKKAVKKQAMNPLGGISLLNQVIQRPRSQCFAIVRRVPYQLVKPCHAWTQKKQWQGVKHKASKTLG